MHEFVRHGLAWFVFDDVAMSAQHSRRNVQYAIIYNPETAQIVYVRASVRAA